MSEADVDDDRMRQLGRIEELATEAVRAHRQDPQGDNLKSVIEQLADILGMASGEDMPRVGGGPGRRRSAVRGDAQVQN